MQISVTGQQIDIDQGLRNYVRERLENGVGKYFDGAIVGHVAFSNEGSMCRTQIQVRVGRGMAWESRADDADIQRSFNVAVDHLEKRLRRHKRKRRGYNRGGDRAAG